MLLHAHYLEHKYNKNYMMMFLKERLSSVMGSRMNIEHTQKNIDQRRAVWIVLKL